MLTDLINLKAVYDKNESMCYGIAINIITRKIKTLICEITSKEDKRYFIPATRAFTTKIDPKEGKIKINSIPGLLDNIY